MKKVLLIVLPIVVIVSTVLGLGFMGILKLPFLPHKPVAKKKAGKDAVAKAAPPPAPKLVTPPLVDPPKPKKKIEAPKPDIEAGEKKLASLWNAMEVDQLSAIVKDWKNPDLASILVKMDADKVSELLGAMEPAKASLLSRAIQAAAAKPKPLQPPA